MLTLDKTMGETYLSMYEMFKAWYKESNKLKNEGMTKDEYDTWRYNYPEYDTTQKLD